VQIIDTSKGKYMVIETVGTSSEPSEIDFFNKEQELRIRSVI